MDIAIDAHMVGEQETGNETYTLNLIRALLRVAGRDPKGFSWDRASVRAALPGTSESPGGWEEGNAPHPSRPRRWGATPRFRLLATHPERLAAALPTLPSFASILRLRPANALLRIPLGLPWLAVREHIDLLHVTYNAPPLSPCPTVVTVHDISFEHYPQFFSLRDRLILKTLVPLSIRRAARVITVSRHAQAEIAARYQVPPERIAVTYEAAGEQFQPVTNPAALQAVRQKYALGDAPFILALGNLQPRKNIPRLVEAFRRATDQLAASSEATPPIIDHRPPFTDHRSPIPSPYFLVIAGKAKWRESEIYQAVQVAGLAERVIFPGYVDDADLPALYSAATVFVYPSLYEGFGLPPLEAMACGVPVICSNVASLPEVVGDAVLTVDPLDTDALAQALVAVVNDAGLRADLAARGLRRAALFSWDRCAVETLAVYADVLHARRKR